MSLNSGASEKLPFKSGLMKESLEGKKRNLDEFVSSKTACSSGTRESSSRHLYQQQLLRHLVFQEFLEHEVCFNQWTLLSVKVFFFKR